MKNLEKLLPIVKQVFSELIFSKRILFLLLLFVETIITYLSLVLYKQTEEFFFLFQILVGMPARLVVTYLFVGKFNYKQVLKLLVVIISIGIIPDLTVKIYKNLTQEQLDIIYNFFKPIFEYLFDSFIRGVFSVSFLIIFCIMSGVFIPTFWRFLSFIFTTEEIPLFAGIKKSFLMTFNNLWLLFKLYLLIFFSIGITVFIFNSDELLRSNLYIYLNFFSTSIKQIENSRILITFAVLLSIISSFLNLFILYIVNNARKEENI